MADFTFEILDSFEVKLENEEDQILCPVCNEDSLGRVSDCFARCHKCGTIIVASVIRMPETYHTSWRNIARLKECYGKDGKSISETK